VTQQPDADEIRPIDDVRLHASQLTQSGQAHRYLTFKEFVRRVPLSASTIRRWLKGRLIPSVQLGGKGHKVLIPESALDMLCQVKAAESSEQAGIGQTVETAEATLSIEALAEKTKLSGPPPKWRANTKWRT